MSGGLKMAFLSHLLRDLGVMYALHLHLVAKKAHGQLPIRHTWTFFAISYGWDVIRAHVSKSAFFEGVGHFERNF